MGDVRVLDPLDLLGPGGLMDGAKAHEAWPNPLKLSLDSNNPSVPTAPHKFVKDPVRGGVRDNDVHVGSDRVIGRLYLGVGARERPAWHARHPRRPEDSYAINFDRPVI